MVPVQCSSPTAWCSLVLYSGCMLNNNIVAWSKTTEVNFLWNVELLRRCTVQDCTVQCWLNFMLVWGSYSTVQYSAESVCHCLLQERCSKKKVPIGRFSSGGISPRVPLLFSRPFLIHYNPRVSCEAPCALSNTTLEMASRILSSSKKPVNCLIYPLCTQ